MAPSVDAGMSAMAPLMEDERKQADRVINAIDR